MENEESVGFNERIFEEKFGLWKERLKPDGEWKDVAMSKGERYEFKLKDEKKLEILKYKAGDIGGFPYSDLWFLLAEIDKKIVGYQVIGVRKERGEIRLAGEDITILDIGKGVGGCLNEVAENVLQTYANENGDVDRINQDDNTVVIRKELEDKGENISKEEVSGLISERQRWLSLFGNNGKAGYKWDDEQKLYIRRYTKGDKVPEIRGKQFENDRDLREEIVK